MNAIARATNLNCKMACLLKLNKGRPPVTQRKNKNVGISVLAESSG